MAILKPLVFVMVLKPQNMACVQNLKTCLAVFQCTLAYFWHVLDLPCSPYVICKKSTTITIHIYTILNVIQMNLFKYIYQYKYIYILYLSIYIIYIYIHLYIYIILPCLTNSCCVVPFLKTQLPPPLTYSIKVLFSISNHFIAVIALPTAKVPFS